MLEESVYRNIRQKFENLEASSVRQWGKMDAAQMMAHCNIPLELGNGVVPFRDESTLMSRTMIRWFVVRSIKKGSFGKNLPTTPSFVIANEKEFEKEKSRILNNLDLFYEKGQKGELQERHPGFGKFTQAQWGGLMGAHLTHHLTQFGL